MAVRELEYDETGERISFVPEDDIEGGRLFVMFDRLKHDDYQGAFLVAQSLLAQDPVHHDALQCREMCMAELRRLYISRVGNLDRVPQLAVEPELVPRYVSDEKERHLLERVDGLNPLAAIIERSELSPLEALGLLSELYLRHVIEFEDE